MKDVGEYSFRKQKYIVCWCTTWNPALSEDEQSDEEHLPIHVRDVEIMLAGYKDEDIADIADAIIEKKRGRDSSEISQVITKMVGSPALGKPKYKSDTVESPDFQSKSCDTAGIPILNHHQQAGRCELIGCQNYIDSSIEGLRRPSATISRMSSKAGLLNLPDSAQEPLDYAFVIALFNRDSPEPTTYREAMSSQDREMWKEAISTEVMNLLKRGVIVEVDPPKGEEIRFVDTKYVFKKKEKNGEIYKYKCRIVARGFTQIDQLDYFETMAPVARSNSLRIFLKISVQREHVRRSIDFDAAFLHSPLGDEVLYCKPFEGYNLTPGKVLRIMKSFYGLKQAGRYWNVMISDFFISKGFTKCLAEQCLFTRNGGRQMILLYVDDAIVSCSTAKEVTEVITEIKGMFELGEEGPLDWYVGSAIEDKGDTIFMHQKDYINKMLRRYEIPEGTIADTPMRERLAILKDPKDELFHKFNIREKVDSLMYAAVSVRPDIAFAVSYVARFTTHPSAEVCKAVNQIFHYLAGSKELGICIRKEVNADAVVYCDADYAGDVNDYKSTSGILAFIGLTLVCWYSSKQSTTAQSSTDSEIISMNFAAKEIVWLRGLLNELSYTQTNPTVLKGDSQSAMMLGMNPVFHKRTKHIMVKFMYLVECLKENTLQMEKVLGTVNWSDILTKPQKKTMFLSCREALGMIRPNSSYQLIMVSIEGGC